MRNRLTPKQREGLKGLVEGRANPNTKKAQKLLNNPLIAVAFEDMLEKAGLSDETLASKVTSIINRKATRNVDKSGKKSTNQHQVDANALNAIKMIWQVKGKFVDKHDIQHNGAIGQLPDDQLDKLIKSGTEFLKVNKVQIGHDRTDSESDNISGLGVETNPSSGD